MLKWCYGLVSCLKASLSEHAAQHDVITLDEVHAASWDLAAKLVTAVHMAAFVPCMRVKKQRLWCWNMQATLLPYHKLEDHEVHVGSRLGLWEACW